MVSRPNRVDDRRVAHARAGERSSNAGVVAAGEANHSQANRGTRGRSKCIGGARTEYAGRFAGDEGRVAKDRPPTAPSVACTDGERAGLTAGPFADRPVRSPGRW